MSEEFDFRPHQPVVEVGPFRVETTPVVHPVDAFALRITADGRSVAYSGDTGACESLDRLAAGADLFLCEASFRDGEANPPDLHMTGSECGTSAGRAGVGRLVLTHVPPWHDAEDALAEARTTWDGPLELAVAGAVYDL
jgi:ribonuclease BN (tRNA processing enzyme)